MFVEVPPCVAGAGKLNLCARTLYAWQVNGLGDLPADWVGWRLAGRFLISPDGDRITPGQLRGLLFQEANRRRCQLGAKSGYQGLVLDLRKRLREIR